MFEKLKRSMLNLSKEELMDFLGKDIVQSLNEWMTTTGILTKDKLIEMIFAVQQSDIIKNKIFRKKILEGFPPAERQISMSSFLLKFEINKDIFKTEKQDTTSFAKIDAYGKFHELLDYQYVIGQRVLNELTSENPLRRMLVQMPTGTGKTKTATHTIVKHFRSNLKKQGLIIWLAHSTELLQQAHDTFVDVWKHVGEGSINVYKLWGDYNLFGNEEMNGFVLCGIGKLMALQKGNILLFNKLVEYCKLLVVDEAHKAAADETRKLIKSFMLQVNGNDRALLGLTATPGRATGLSVENDLLTSLFDGNLIGVDVEVMNRINNSQIVASNTVVERDIIRHFQNRGVLSKIIKEELEYPVNFTQEELDQIKVDSLGNTEKDFSNKALEIIGRNRNRNLAVVNKLKILNNENLPTIVFACSIKHAQLLSAFLSIDGIPNAVVTGDMSTYDRQNAIERFKNKGDPINILINFGVLTTGFDAPNIKCVFVARPTQSVVLYSQIIGRGLRGPQMGGNEECLLIDVKDNLKKFNEHLAYKHFNNYWE